MFLQPFEHTHPPTRIVSGPGSVSRLPELMQALGVRRALVVCGRTVAAGPQLQMVRSSLGDLLVGVFDGVRPHGGLANLQAGADVVTERAADVLISVGGGAAIDSAKCMALLLAREAPLEAYRAAKGQTGTVVARRLPPTMAHIAIPTTAGSSSEIMPWAGIRDEQTRHKLLFRDPQLIPRVAVLDPAIVAPTGPELTATSGMTAVARAIETLYSRVRQPLADAYALHALEMMARALPRAVADGSDLEARGLTQVGALISGIAADNAMVSLVHAVGHAVGGRYALQHGVAHGILLAPVARLCLPLLGPMQHKIAAALGADTRGAGDAAAGAAAAEALSRLVASLPLPRRLRDVGVTADELGAIADAAMADPMFYYCPRPFDRHEVVAILEQAW